MKISVTSRLLEKYPGSTFVAVLAKNFANEKKHKKLEEERANVIKFLRDNISDAAKVPIIKEQRKFHKKFDKSFPIEFQVDSIIKGKDIPVQSTLKDVLFISEMKHCCMISGHDLDTISENLVFDLSKGNEMYQNILGKPQDLKKNDIVLIDKGEVITSLLYGPGSSTKITDKTKSCLYLFWFSSAIADAKLTQIVEDFQKSLQLISHSDSSIEVIDVTIFDEEKEEDFIVTPWDVKGDVDYQKLIKKFGTTPISSKLIKRMEKHTGDAHYFLRRKKFFSHRDFDKILDHYEKGEEFALYTGRGPSNNITLGHIVPWLFTKWLQDKFDVELYFEITDGEKYLVKDLTLEETKKWAYENILDIIALGFNPKKTFIFLDTELGKTQFRLATEISKKITLSTAKAAFGFTNDTSIGLIFHPAVQAAPCYLPTYLKGKQIPVLIPAAIDQDPYWRVTRDLATKVGFPKPAQIHSSFLPGLKEGGKMSASDPTSTIYVTDDAKTVRKKIMKYAFSGGKETIEEHRKHGGNPDIDIAYQYLTFFEEDDEKLKQIYNDYKSGKLLTGELKQICVGKINEFLAGHQKRRKEAEKIREQFMLRD